MRTSGALSRGETRAAVARNRLSRARALHAGRRGHCRQEAKVGTRKGEVYALETEQQDFLAEANVK